MENFFSNIIRKIQPTTKRAKRNLVIVGYSLVLVVLVAVIGTTYRSPVAPIDQLASQGIIDDVRSTVAPGRNAYISQAAEADLAANIAERANLSITNLAWEQAVAVGIQSDLAQTETDSVQKPIVLPGGTNSAVVSYVTVDGDTVPSLAEKFGISTQTIKWANNLTGDGLNAGATLYIPTVDGVVYTVKDGDTLDSIVGKYGSAANRILAVNDIDEIRAGEMIVLPDGDLPTNERPGYVAPSATPASARSNNYSFSYAGYGGGNSRFLYVNTKPTTPGNRNYWGNCTWFAWEYRLSIGRPLPSVALGNANVWHISLAGHGYQVGRTPAFGAVQQTSSGWAGHVAVVVGVAPNGDVTIHEMNSMGYNIVSERTMSANEAAGYNYIY